MPKVESVRLNEKYSKDPAYKRAQRSGHKKYLDGALPWHGPKSPQAARAGSKGRNEK